MIFFIAIFLYARLLVDLRAVLSQCLNVNGSEWLKMLFKLIFIQVLIASIISGEPKVTGMLPERSSNRQLKVMQIQCWHIEFSRLPKIHPKLFHHYVKKLIIKGCEFPEQFLLVANTFPQVQSFVFKNANGSPLNDDDFDEPLSITSIELDSSVLGKMNRLTFSKMPQLKEIVVTRSSGSVLKLESRDLDNNSNVVNFTMTDNRAVILGPNLFANKPNLMSVILRSNAIEFLPNSLFSNSTNIQIIDLSGNRLESFQW